MRILGVSGSLRADSHNTLLLREAAELFDAEVVDFELFDGLRDVPPYDEDDDVDDGPAGAARFRAALAEADGVLIATPEYNSSIPGQLKNALDWASRPYATNPFRDKTVAVVSSSTGVFGGLQAQADLKRVLARMGARIAETGLAVPRAHERLAEPDEALRENVQEALQALYAAAAAAAPGRLAAAA